MRASDVTDVSHLFNWLTLAEALNYHLDRVLLHLALPHPILE